MGELKQKAIKGVAWNTINTLGSKCISFVVSIILARLLMPADYGAVAMVCVFTSVLSIFSDGGLTMALVRKEDRTEADKATVFYYNIVACYFIYGLVFLIAPLIADFYNMPVLCKLARVSSLTLLISPFAGIQRMHLTSSIDFKRIAIVGIAGTIVSSIISVWMAFNGFGVYALAVPPIFSTACTTVMLIYMVRWRPRTGFSMNSFRSLFGYSSKLLGSQLLDTLYVNITPLIVGKFFSPAQLGLYERAKGWPAFPSQTFSGVLQSVTFPVLSKMQDDVERLAINYRRILRVSAFVVFPMMVGLAAVARPLTIVLVTEKWIDSVLLMQLICFSMMWYPIHAINLNLLLVMGHTDFFLKLEIIKKVWGLVVMCCALPFGLVAFCVAGILSTYVSLFINTWYTKKIIKYGFWEQLRDLLPFLFNCLVMGAICLLVQLPFESNIMKLMLAIPIGIFYYIVTSYVFSGDEFNELINIIKRK